MKIEHGVIIGGVLHVATRIEDYLPNAEIEEICMKCSLKERCSDLKAAGDIFCDSLFGEPSVYFKEVESGWSLSIKKPRKETGSAGNTAGR